ncbi:MAG TPA: DUF3305 domain-containing protein [Microvirga sp.]|jgi:hypothetical protein|nr:DUF3305 domain-containing protein [Microvirga sp.]
MSAPVPNHHEIGIVVEKRPFKGPWGGHEWRPVAILPAAPSLAVGARLGSEAGGETFYAGAATLDLHLRATGHYRDNLVSGRPSVWVVVRPVGEEVELVSATVDPYEGEALAESIGDVVEAVPMPQAVQDWVQAFFDAFHVEQVFFKRKRERADPDALARRNRASREDGE